MTKRKSYYSLKNLLVQSPEEIKTAILAVITLICAALGLDPDLITTLGVGLVIERLLNLLYVKPVKRVQERAALNELADHTLRSIDLGQKLPRKAA